MENHRRSNSGIVKDNQETRDRKSAQHAAEDGYKHGWTAEQIARDATAQQQGRGHIEVENIYKK